MLTVSLAAMRDAGNQNLSVGIVDNVQHSVVADTHPPLVVETDKLARTRGPRVITQAVNCCVNSLPNIRRECLEVACRGGSDLN